MEEDICEVLESQVASLESQESALKWLLKPYAGKETVDARWNKNRSKPVENKSSQVLPGEMNLATAMTETSASLASLENAIFSSSGKLTLNASLVRERQHQMPVI